MELHSKPLPVPSRSSYCVPRVVRAPGETPGRLAPDEMSLRLARQAIAPSVSDPRFLRLALRDPTLFSEKLGEVASGLFGVGRGHAGDAGGPGRDSSAAGNPHTDGDAGRRCHDGGGGGDCAGKLAAIGGDDKF